MTLQPGTEITTTAMKWTMRVTKSQRDDAFDQGGPTELVRVYFDDGRVMEMREIMQLIADGTWFIAKGDQP